MLNVCIIGCGMMGEFHVAAWRNRADARIVAVCDLIEERRNKLAASCGAAAYDDYRQALDHPGIHVVSICTPVFLHAPMACLAAQHRCHMLVEKPIALTLDQADAMIRTAAENRVLLSVSFQYRAWSRCVKYREMIRRGDFGGPVFFRFTDIREVRPKLAMHARSMNGGPIIDMAGHYFDLVRYFTGEEPQRVFARGHVFGRGKPRLAEVHDLAIDAASLEVSYGGGHTLAAFINWGMPEDFPVIGDEMLIGPDLCARPVQGGIELIRGSHKEIMTLAEDPKGPAARIDGLINAIRGDVPLEVTGQDGRIALACSLAALQSVDARSAIEMDPSAFPHAAESIRLTELARPLEGV